MEKFEFTYSAKEQDEIRKIREKYVAPEKTEDKMEQLRRLDESVTNKASAASLAVGIIGALVLGLGMSLAMSELGALVGSLAMPLGIVIGLVGIVLVSIAYPLYNKVIRRERERIAPEIIRLTDELTK